MSAPNIRPGHEPSANSRQAASALFDLFQALLREGFTEQQALSLLGAAVANGGKK